MPRTIALIITAVLSICSLLASCGDEIFDSGPTIVRIWSQDEFEMMKGCTVVTEDESPSGDKFFDVELESGRQCLVTWKNDQTLELEHHGRGVELMCDPREADDDFLYCDQLGQSAERTSHEQVRQLILQYL